MSLTATTEALRAAGCVFAEDEARLLCERAGSDELLAAMVTRRVAGQPLEHVLGWVEFCGLELAVTAGVFVPRARTQLLVAEAVRTLACSAAVRPVVVDLCCGCGAIGVAISTRRDVELHAVDIDPAALHCARDAVAAAGGTAYLGDLDEPLPPRLIGSVDVLVANAPYVPTADLSFLPAEAREHEPLTALDGGGDGLEILRRVLEIAPRWLSPGGAVMVETSDRQASRLQEIATAAGLQPRIVRDDELGATVLFATREVLTHDVRHLAGSV